MAGGSETQVASTELERVQSKVPTLFDRDDTFFSQLEKRPVEVISARDMRIPLEIKPGGKSGHFDPDGGDLRRGDSPTFDKAVINTVHLKHAVEWTTKAEWATDDSRKAVVNLFRHNLAKGMAEFRRFCDSLCMTAGNGVIATICTVNSQTSFNCTPTASFGDGYGTRLLRDGMDVNIYNAALTVRKTTTIELTINSLDLANKSFTTATAPDVAAVAGDVVVVSGLTATPPVSMLGVPYHNSSASVGFWLGMDRSVLPAIRSSAVNANGASLTLPVPRLALNKIGDRVGMEAVKKHKMTAWTHPCQLQSYEELGMQYMQIQKTSKEDSLDLYFNDNMKIAGVPLKTSYSWNKTRIDFIALDAWGRAEFHKPGFYSRDGKKIWEVRGASGGVVTSNIFYIVASFNIFVNNPAETAYIYNLAVPSGY